MLKISFRTSMFFPICFAFFTFFLFCEAQELRQINGDLSFLLQEAQATQQRLVIFLNGLKSKYISASIVFDSGIKQMPTIQQLLNTRWNGDASRITDYSRATIAVENIYQVYHCLEDIKKSSLEIVKERDNFLLPYPNKYRDINIVFRDLKNGHLGEIQINTIPMLEFKNSSGHHLFDEVRNIQARGVQESRPLSGEEEQKIAQLTMQGIIGHNNAFESSMKIANKTLRVGIYGILIYDNEVLMVKTKSGSKIIYNFPGGGVESKEGLAEALLRECKEELNVDAIIRDRLYISKDLYTHEDFDNYMFNLYYKIEVENKDIISRGRQIDVQVNDIKWFPINKLPFDEMLPIDREFIAFLQAQQIK